jgi:UDP-GlcNAc:undecaprenyl-phosphate GlcNAc-1-phosphate transferase
LHFNPKQLPLLLVAVLYVPILDTCRVMMIRLLNGGSMFSPDRNHIHHIIVDYGLSHRKASSFIGFVNFGIGLFMFSVITSFNILQSTLMLISIFASGILLLFLMNKNKTALRLKVKLKASMLRMFFYIW